MVREKEFVMPAFLQINGEPHRGIIRIVVAWFVRGFIFWNVAFIDDLRKPVDFAPYPAPMDSRYPWAREESEPSDGTNLMDQLSLTSSIFPSILTIIAYPCIRLFRPTSR
jgi:hypothetical protein